MAEAMIGSIAMITQASCSIEGWVAQTAYLGRRRAVSHPVPACEWPAEAVNEV